MFEFLSALQLLLLIIILFVVSKNKFTQPVRSGGASVILDSCALIDGRVADIAATGFLPKNVIVPRFIVEELQLLADGQDAHKRERARHGLDVIKVLQGNELLNVEIKKDQPPVKRQTVDDRLLALAQRVGADLITTDYNLNKVAAITGIKVLNVNELANAIRPVILPGEKKQVRIVQKGSNKDQGVGYLEDGSMIVVAGAARSIGKTVQVEISRYIQTDAGKMLFAQKLGTDKPSRSAVRK